MALSPPNIPEAEIEAFTCAIGKAIHNYGVIEHLVNDFLLLLNTDGLLASNVLQQGITKRLELLESLFSRKEHFCRDLDLGLGSLFSSAKAAFRERNKIAHNPFYIRVNRETGKVEMGILVVRHHDDADREEWINRPRLDQLSAESRVIFSRLGQLRHQCQTSA